MNDVSRLAPGVYCGRSWPSVVSRLPTAGRPAVRGLLGSREGLLVNCRPESGPVTEEVYRLCMCQFESMPNIVEALVACGKLAPWVGKGTEE